MSDLPEELVITLRKPVTVADETIYELRLSEPNVNQLDQFVTQAEKVGGIKAMAALIASVADVNVVIVGKIGARDFKLAEGYLTRFFDDSPTTTAT